MWLPENALHSSPKFPPLPKEQANKTIVEVSQYWNLLCGKLKSTWKQLWGCIDEVKTRMNWPFCSENGARSLLLTRVSAIHVRLDIDNFQTTCRKLCGNFQASLIESRFLSDLFFRTTVDAPNGSRDTTTRRETYIWTSQIFNCFIFYCTYCTKNIFAWVQASPKIKRQKHFRRTFLCRSNQKQTLIGYFCVDWYSRKHKSPKTQCRDTESLTHMSPSSDQVERCGGKGEFLSQTREKCERKAQTGGGAKGGSLQLQILQRVSWTQSRFSSYLRSFKLKIIGILSTGLEVPSFEYCPFRMRFVHYSQQKICDCRNKNASFVTDVCACSTERHVCKILIHQPINFSFKPKQT